MEKRRTRARAALEICGTRYAVFICVRFVFHFRLFGKDLSDITRTLGAPFCSARICENVQISVVYYTAFMMCVMDKLAMIFYVENTQLHNNDITKSNTAGANCQRAVVLRIAVRTPMAGGGGCSSSCVRVHARSMFCSVLRAAGRQPWRCNGHH